MSRLVPTLPLIVLALAACQGEDPARAERRQDAARAACVAEELAVQAGTRIAALDTLSATPMGSVMAQRTYPFVRGYYDHAKLSERRMALLDSAAAAASPEDSAGFATRAAAGAPGRGRPGTPEANAVERYNADSAAAMGNPSHPCNAPQGEEK